MGGTVRDKSSKRGFWPRLGVAALNLLVPGLGLIRLNDWRLGLAFLFAPFVFVALFVFGQGHFPVVGYYSAIFALVLTFGLLAALYVAPIILTWSRSRRRTTPIYWARWYSITAIAIVILTLWQFLQPIMQHFYKGYYLPSESMSPTAEKNDKVIANMRWRGPLERGEILIFRGPDSVRISRIAAIEGDRIAMRNGVPVVNGVAAVQTRQGPKAFVGHFGAQMVTAFDERLPGETSSHQILDAGPSEFDNMREAVVPKDHFFVLGDNRDSRPIAVYRCGKLAWAWSRRAQ